MIASDNARSWQWVGGRWKRQKSLLLLLLLTLHFVPTAVAGAWIGSTPLCKSCYCRQVQECRSDGASVVSDKREGGIEGELLASWRWWCTACCSGPRNVKVCTRRRREKRDSKQPDPDLIRRYQTISQRRWAFQAGAWSTFDQMQKHVFFFKSISFCCLTLSLFLYFLLIS